MSVFGGVSKGERNRIRIRVRTAMAAQAQQEGRFLGGPPAVRLPARRRRPAPQPRQGRRRQAVARTRGRRASRRRGPAHLRRVPRRAWDRRDRRPADRRQHPLPVSARSRTEPTPPGTGRGKSAVRAILTNPRNTGCQVWNRQRKDEVLIDVHDVALGHMTRQRWNDPDRWIYSAHLAHAPVIDAETFAEAGPAAACVADRADGHPQAPRHHPLLPAARPAALRDLQQQDGCQLEQQPGLLPVRPARERGHGQRRPPARCHRTGSRDRARARRLAGRRIRARAAGRRCRLLCSWAADQALRAAGHRQRCDPGRRRIPGHFPGCQRGQQGSAVHAAWTAPDLSPRAAQDGNCAHNGTPVRCQQDAPETSCRR
jgi:hypothetical protein